MAESAADQPIASEELEKLEETFGPVEPIDDELLSSAADLPLLDAKPVAARTSSDSRGLTRALWFVGTVVAGMLVLQAAQVFLGTGAGHGSPQSGGPVGAPPATAAPTATATPTPSDEVWRLLQETRLRLGKSAYEDVVRVLEPLAADPARLDSMQRFDMYVLLAHAHRELGNVEKAQKYTLLATEQNIERREPSQAIEHAGLLVDQGLHEDARRELFRLLARRDALPAKDADYLAIAETRVGDAWYAQAKSSGHLAPLPGADRPEHGR
jgi:hypothetical protein